MSTPRIKQSYIAEAGVSGGLLAAAAIAFISLVGVVSLALWPHSGGGADSATPPILTPIGSGETPAGPAPALVPPAPTTAPSAAVVEPAPKGASKDKGDGASKRVESGQRETPVAVVPEKDTTPGSSGDRQSRTVNPDEPNGGGSNKASNGGGANGGGRSNKTTKSGDAKTGNDQVSSGTRKGSGGRVKRAAGVRARAAHGNGKSNGVGSGPR